MNAYAVLLYVVSIGGLVPAAMFLILYRPGHWNYAAFDVAGSTLVFCGLFARSLYLTILGPIPEHPGPERVVATVVLGGLAVAWLWGRLVYFVFTRNRNSRKGDST